MIRKGCYILAAVSENGVIGREGGLPWKLPSEAEKFRDLTMRRVVIMGRRTAERLGAPLQGRFNIVVSRSGRAGFRSDMRYAPNVEIVKDFNRACVVAREKSNEWRREEYYVIGGEAIFKEALRVAERLLISRVHADVAGDAFFPPVPETYVRVGGLHRKARPGDDYDVTFEVWRRNA